MKRLGDGGSAVLTLFREPSKAGFESRRTSMCKGPEVEGTCGTQLTEGMKPDLTSSTGK